MKKMNLRFAFIPILLAAFAAAALAQTAPVRYTVDFDPQPNTHMLHVSLEVSGVKAPTVDVAFPAWSPGAYRITDTWRQVQEFGAADGDGSTLKFGRLTSRPGVSRAAKMTRSGEVQPVFARLQ